MLWPNKLHVCLCCNPAGQRHCSGARHPHGAGAGGGAQYPPDRRDLQRQSGRSIQPPVPDAQQAAGWEGLSRLPVTAALALSLSLSPSFPYLALTLSLSLFLSLSSTWCSSSPILHKSDTSPVIRYCSWGDEGLNTQRYSNLDILLGSFKPLSCH